MKTSANTLLELSFDAARPHADPFNEVDLDVVVTGGDGGQWRVPGFWSGGGTFRARFSAPAPGRYRWESVCSSADDPGLHGRTGEFEVRPYEGDNPLLRHGRLRVAPGGRGMTHADGTPFLWLADTWWFGLVKRFRYPADFAQLARDRRAKGFNVVQIVCGPLPDFDAANNPWDPQQESECGLSWERGWTRINPAFFDRADQRIAHLVAHGLVPCIVGMWGYFMQAMGVDRARRHWRYLVARYGAYPVVWCVAGETTMTTYSRMDAPAEQVKADEGELQARWTEVARCVRALDPWHSLVTTHPRCPLSSRVELQDAALVDFEMLQVTHTGTSGLRRCVEMLLGRCAVEPPVPVLNGESNYEGILGTCGADVQRYMFWSHLTSGACGHTYGAQGIWAMSAPQSPHRGDTGDWGSGSWRDAMGYAGAGQVGLAARLLRSYPTHRFVVRREPEAERAGRLCSLGTGIPGALAMFYLPWPVEEALLGMRRFNWKNEILPIRLDDGVEYRSFFWNPQDGTRVEAGAARGGADGVWTPPPMPSRADWVLVLENSEALSRVR